MDPISCDFFSKVRFKCLEANERILFMEDSLNGLFLYNRFHNILRLFDVLINFPFTTVETMCDYYLKTWCI